MRVIYAQRAWTPVQRKWLGRLAQQLVHEVVMDREDVQRVFIGDGGAPQLDRLLDGRLDHVLDTLGDTVWERAG
jgi:type I restriction enzyme R subunit